MAVGVVARLRRDERLPARLGVAGALLLVMGISTYLSMIHPPYLTDESSHLGYTMSLQEGTLPSLDTEVPLIEGDEIQARALSRPWPFSLPYIHVAINPPYPYLAAIPATEATEAATLSVSVRTNQVIFEAGGVVRSSRLIDGQFPY